MKIIPVLVSLVCLSLFACDDDPALPNSNERLDADVDAAAIVDRGMTPNDGSIDADVPDGMAPPLVCDPWPGALWTQDVGNAALHPDSIEMIETLRAQGGWGNQDRFQIDFSIKVLAADATTPHRAFLPSSDFFEPDCDHVEVPVPVNGALEGESGYRCDGDGDCHLIVIDAATNTLYEMWRAHIDGDGFRGGCLAVWDMTALYGPVGRGEQCTSADAAGLPIAPLLFSADEVAAGTIEHAIRFVLPNDRIRNRTYVRPATHATGAASGGELALAYGARLRLRADYPVDMLSPGAQVVADALQRYGMILADGGNIALTAESDAYTAGKWADLLGPHDLNMLRVEDFEVVDTGDALAWTGDCVRAQPMPCAP